MLVLATRVKQSFHRGTSQLFSFPAGCHQHCFYGKNTLKTWHKALRVTICGDFITKTPMYCQSAE